MGACFRFIAIAFCLILGFSGLVQAEEQACLACHPVHYQDAGSCTDCHLGRADTGRKEIAHYRMLQARFSAFTLENSPVVERGTKLLEKTACRRCHISGGKGNKFAANLDWSPHNASAEELFESIRVPAIFMPDFHFSDRQIIELINAIHGASRKAAQPDKEVPVLIHFADLQRAGESVFEKKCGNCHRMLTEHRGGLGDGYLAPNLSGLLSDFYPKSYPEKKSWTLQGVQDWLKNPRKLLKKTRMAPVPLSEEEWLNLQKEVLKDD